VDVLKIQRKSHVPVRGLHIVRESPSRVDPLPSPVRKAHSPVRGLLVGIPSAIGLWLVAAWIYSLLG
jgi:hypothetical protein